MGGLAHPNADLLIVYHLTVLHIRSCVLSLCPFGLPPFFVLFHFSYCIFYYHVPRMHLVPVKVDSGIRSNQGSFSSFWFPKSWGILAGCLAFVVLGRCGLSQLTLNKSDGLLYIEYSLFTDPTIHL